jgi:ring-1,2-phenylacetyl-CoA epoxidase subunit PaaD
VNLVADPLLEQVHALAGAVPDPEIPVVTLSDLGILRSVTREREQIVVTLTPTYTGCPATEVIRDDVQRALVQAGLHGVQVRLTLSPPWTTDWISLAGRAKLRDYGIAPPARAAQARQAEAQVLQFVSREQWRAGAVPKQGDTPPADTLAKAEGPACPQCGASQVECVSEYGSTPCKALYRCLKCREPFDYFKPY